MVVFHAVEFLIIRTQKNARNIAWTSQKLTKPCQIFMCFVVPTPWWAKGGNSIDLDLSVWCTVMVESDLRDSIKKYFFDVLMFPLFGKISWRKKWLSSVILKTKSEEMECVISILSTRTPYFQNELHIMFVDRSVQRLLMDRMWSTIWPTVRRLWHTVLSMFYNFNRVFWRPSNYRS